MRTCNRLIEIWAAAQSSGMAAYAAQNVFCVAMELSGRFS